MFCVLKIEVMGWWGLRVWGLEDGMGRDGGEGMFVRARRDIVGGLINLVWIGDRRYFEGNDILRGWSGWRAPELEK